MDITYTKHGDYYYPDLTLLPQPTGDIEGASARHLCADADGEHPDTAPHRH